MTGNVDPREPAAAASRGDALGDEHRALSVPTLYYWSRETTPPATREYIRRHTLPNVEFVGGGVPAGGPEQLLQRAVRGTGLLVQEAP
jgi:hypothetical protein